MKHIEIQGKKVVMYDSIDELPIRRFHKWQKLLMVAAGVGGTLAEFDSHIERVVTFLKTNDRDNAVKELENLRQNVNMMQSEVPLAGMAFASLIQSVDGKECNDISEDGLQRTLDLLGGVTFGQVQAETLASKKKIDHELTIYFPAVFDDVVARQYYDDVKKRTMLILEGIISGENSDEVQALTDKLVTTVKPQTWTGVRSVEVVQDKAFEDLCLAMSKEFGVDAKRFTVMEYYTAQETLAKLAKKRSNRARKR